MAAFELKMPKLGESVTEGTIGKWLKQPGEHIGKYDLVVEVQTDKVNTEIPSPIEGTLTEIKVQEGETVPVGTLLAMLDAAAADGGQPAATAESAAEPAATAGAAAEPAAAGTAAGTQTKNAPDAQPAAQGQRPAAGGQSPAGAGEGKATVSAAAEAPAAGPGPQSAQADGAGGDGAEAPANDGAARAREDGAAASADGGSTATRTDVRATPAVRKLAAEHGIDLGEVEGTGLGGRVSRQDVERFIAARSAGPVTGPPPTGAPAATPAGAPEPTPAQPRAAAPQREAAAGDELVPLSQMRKAIANAMVLSKTTIPHAAAMVEVDWTNVARLRAGAKADFAAREGFELTFLPFAIRAVCEALRKNPLVNAAWTDKGVLRLKAINLGVAIGLEDEGLVVPVIKNADELSITGIARAVRDLATRARSKKLTLADFEGGTFTVNNGGTFGTYLSYPIVNPPQAAIMTTEAITKRVVVLEDDVIAIRSMGNMVMSFDHRVMDGATAARFLRDVKTWIQGVNASVPIS